MGILGRDWRAEEDARKIMKGIEHDVDSRHFLQLQHGQTYYELDPEEDRPLLICIHGWSTASYVWRPLKRFLRAKGYRVLSYDLYGRGFSDRPDVNHTAELFTHQLTELLESLELNDKKLNIVGYSMGGAIAARFLRDRLDDVERLLLIAPAGMVVSFPFMRFVARNIPKFFDPIILANLPRVLRGQFNKAAEGFPDDDDVQFVRQRQLDELNYKGYIPALLSSLKGVLASRMADEHRAIANSHVKVLAIFAENDKTIPSSFAKLRFDIWNRNKVSRVIKGAGHAVTYTHAKQIDEEIGDFL